MIESIIKVYDEVSQLDLSAAAENDFTRKAVQRLAKFDIRGDRKRKLKLEPDIVVCGMVMTD